MNLTEQLSEDVARIFRDPWTTKKGMTVPDTETLKLGNDSVELEGTVLYADLSASTALVDTSTPSFAADVYKAYLRCAARIIEAEKGTITAYDGDRVMGVFVGEAPNTCAVRAALKINYAVTNIVNPAIKKQYPDELYSVNHVVGVDRSKLFVAKTGVRGANDLVWVGRAANYAAKLSTLSEAPTYITDAVYSAMQSDVKVHKGISMWEKRLWTTMKNMVIYRSVWMWQL